MRNVYYAGYLAIPLAFLVHLWLGHGRPWEPVATFFLAGLGVVPLAHVMGRATEELSERTGPTWGGLLNATFGNAAELISGVVALTKGLNGVVRASLTGSILGNLLLVAGGAMLAGGWKREKQVFSKESAQTNAGMLALAVASMLFPAIFDFSYRYYDQTTIKQHEQAVSIGTGIILLIVYALGLLFTLRTHSHIFTRRPAESPEDPPGMSALPKHPRATASVKHSVGMLLLASLGIAVVAELLVGSAEQMAHRLGWNDIFVGVILLAIIGNAAEHSTALLLARRNDMDTAMTISYQSSLQIALFVTPVLVLISTALVALGWVHPDGDHAGGRVEALNLVFSPMEVVAVVLTVGIVVVLGMDGETNWFEGVMLLALYVILGLAFFYIPVPSQRGYDNPGGAVPASRPAPDAKDATRPAGEGRGAAPGKVYHSSLVLPGRSRDGRYTR
jgi:Ca2+:H+ antiporter